LLDIETAITIAAAVRGRIEIVGVFVNEQLNIIRDIAQKVPLNRVQLHGDEMPEFVREVKSATRLPVIKALRVTTGFDPGSMSVYGADSILLDSFSSTKRGGTGHTFDWEVARRARAVTSQLYLAGGLNPANACDAIKAVEPYALDICSGVESTPGKKDAEKMRDLFRAIREEV
jgi:phosphoribosylanthranilate isomerase